MDDELIIDVDYSAIPTETYQDSSPSFPLPPSFDSVQIPELTPRSDSSYQSEGFHRMESSRPYSNSPRPELYSKTEIYYPKEVAEEFEEVEETEVSLFDSFKSIATQHAFIIHSIADLILFYVFFRFVQSLYKKTEDKLEETRELITQLQKQYGLKRKMK